MNLTTVASCYILFCHSCSLDWLFPLPPLDLIYLVKKTALRDDQTFTTHNSLDAQPVSIPAVIVTWCLIYSILITECKSYSQYSALLILSSFYLIMQALFSRWWEYNPGWALFYGLDVSLSKEGKGNIEMSIAMIPHMKQSWQQVLLIISAFWFTDPLSIFCHKCLSFDFSSSLF